MQHASSPYMYPLKGVQVMLVLRVGTQHVASDAEGLHLRCRSGPAIDA